MMGFILSLPAPSYASTTNTGPNSDNPAASPASSPAASPTVRLREPVKQNPTWVAAKYSFRVFSGINPNLPIKGQKISPFVLPISPLKCPTPVANSAAPNPLCGSTPPTAYTLTQDTYNKNTWEPSDGTEPNSPGGSSADDLGDAYNSNIPGVPSNKDFYDLCGPGATDIALDFWPAPPNLLENVTDDPDYDKAVNYTRSINLQTYWNGTRMRGYMTYLAWQTQAPTWPTAGMMDTSTYPSNGVTEYDIQDALNWEASGHNVSTWQNYFYLITWWNKSSASGLNQDVVTDVANSHVPVVAEVNAAMLPNWVDHGPGLVKHQIAIIGYDNIKGTYTYVDTCANFTKCNVETNPINENNWHTVPQSTMWQAIIAVPVNTSPLPQYGDGGWVW